LIIVTKSKLSHTIDDRCQPRRLATQRMASCHWIAILLNIPCATGLHVTTSSHRSLLADPFEIWKVALNFFSDDCLSSIDSLFLKSSLSPYFHLEISDTMYCTSKTFQGLPARIGLGAETDSSRTWQKLGCLIPDWQSSTPLHQ
jgi:hypothetical protein